LVIWYTDGWDVYSGHTNRPTNVDVTDDGAATARYMFESKPASAQAAMYV
jgi:hypothetical protein